MNAIKSSRQTAAWPQGQGSKRVACTAVLLLLVAGVSCVRSPSAEYRLLVGQLRGPGDEEVKERVFEEFMQLGKEDAHFAAETIMEEDSPVVKASSIQLIARHFGRQYMPLYRKLALDPNINVSWPAVSTLFDNTAEPEDIGTMRRLVHESAFVPVKGLAMRWLLEGPRRTADLVPDALAGLDSEHQEVRTIAVAFLVSLEWPIGGQEAPRLIQFLREHKEDIKDEGVHPDVYYALEFLEQLRDQWKRKPWLDDFETQEARIERVLGWWDNWETDNPWKRRSERSRKPEAGPEPEGTKD